MPASIGKWLAMGGIVVLVLSIAPVGPENLQQLKSLTMPIGVVIFEPGLSSPIRHSG